MSKTYDLILFDLDGTVTDSAPGIVNSVIYALRHMGVTEYEPAALLAFVGPPLSESFRKFFGFTEAQITQAIAYYREYYAEKGILENTVYAGVEPLLLDLKSKGFLCCLATSKPEQFAHRILSHFQLEQYFDFVGGATMDHRRSKKADVIDYVLTAFPSYPKDRIVMVGDRDQDVIGANRIGIHSIGVLYGYGSEQELLQAGATHLAKTPTEILQILTTKEH